MTDQYKEYMSHASLAFNSEQYETVLNDCQKAIELDKLSLAAYSLAGNACLMLDRLSDAEEFFIQAIEINNEDGELYFYLGNSQFGQEKYHEAIKSYAKAEQLGCEDVYRQKIYYMMGLINQIWGDKQAALINFDKTDSISGKNADKLDMLLNRIQIYIENGNFAKAEEYAWQYKMLMPGEFKSYQLLFQILVGNRKLKEATKILSEAGKIFSKDKQIITEIAFDHILLNCYQAEHNVDKMEEYFTRAIKVIDKLMAMDSISALLMNELLITKAEIKYKLGNNSEAMSLAKKVADIDDVTDNELLDCIDRARFLISEYMCNVAKQYNESYKYATLLKKSNNSFYKYYGCYTEAYSARKLVQENPSLNLNARELYDKLIANLRSYSASKPYDFIAFLYRAKAYADIGRYEKAIEIGKALPEDAMNTLLEYIQKCKEES